MNLSRMFATAGWVWWDVAGAGNTPQDVREVRSDSRIYGVQRFRAGSGVISLAVSR